MRLDPITLQDKATRVKRDHTTRTNRHFFLFDVRRLTRDERYKLQSDEHSVLEPPLPIPNRTVKRDRANDSAHPCVKVGHRQTNPMQTPCSKRCRGFGLYVAGNLKQIALIKPRLVISGNGSSLSRLPIAHAIKRRHQLGKVLALNDLPLGGVNWGGGVFSGMYPVRGCLGWWCADRTAPGAGLQKRL